MAFFLNMSPRRLLAVILVALAVIVAGTWVAVKVATDVLLYQSATTTARNWAQLLAGTVTDLEQIAGGEMPTSASMTFFEWTRRTGQVFRYEVYDLQGYSQLVAQDSVSPVDLAEFSADAVAALQSGIPRINLNDTEKAANDGAAKGFPSFYAEAFVPAFVDGRPVAIVAAYVDQTAARARFREAFLVAGGSLCLLTGLAFGVPALAWWRRTREKQIADRRILYMAHHDALTGLINRARLVERLDAAMAALTETGATHALLFIDVDRFKEVNDSLGHDGGDHLLRTIAQRLCAITRQHDEVGRLGGDEFVVLLNAIEGRDQVAEFAKRMSTAVAEPIRFNDQEFRATLSVGAALAPKDGETPDRLLKSADLAVYKAKADGRACVRFFTPELDAELMARIRMERLLRHALAGDRFELHYQPEYEIDRRRLIGFEALIRLRDEGGNLLAPGEFLPLAEELKLIDQIGEWTLDNACRTAAGWPHQLKIAVNVSPGQFATGGLSETVARALQRTGLGAGRLELEITETHLISDSAGVIRELYALKEMGVAVVMGQFGTGTSSLSYLWRFPFDKIKIDRSFMLGYEGFENQGRDAETVVRTIVALGRELHMGVTVEGVESDAQMAFLDRVDADRAQGFYFSQPLPVSAVDDLIAGAASSAAIGSA